MRCFPEKRLILSLSSGAGLIDAQMKRRVVDVVVVVFADVGQFSAGLGLLSRYAMNSPHSVNFFTCKGGPERERVCVCVCVRERESMKQDFSRIIHI